MTLSRLVRSIVLVQCVCTVMASAPAAGQSSAAAELWPAAGAEAMTVQTHWTRTIERTRRERVMTARESTCPKAVQAPVRVSVPAPRDSPRKVPKTGTLPAWAGNALPVPAAAPGAVALGSQVVLLDPHAHVLADPVHGPAQLVEV